jgi:hypothetical protein
VNLSERLAKAAQDRRNQHEAAKRGLEVTTVGASALDLASVPSYLPAPIADPVDHGQPEPMKMRLPEAAAPFDPETGRLPLWQRPVVDVGRDEPLATVTTLPVVPVHDVDDAEFENAELAEPIPMRGEWLVPPVAVDRDELHVPPLAAFEAEGLANGLLRTEHLVRHHDEHVPHAHADVQEDTVIDLDEFAVDAEIIHHDDTVIDLDEFAVDAEIIHHDDTVIDLDEIAVDAEIIEPSSADELLEQWSAGVDAYAHAQSEKVDGLYRQLVDVAQQPRITFGPIDLRVGVSEATAHFCPQCGATARIDIHDPIRGRIHLSCDSCYKMWQERVDSTVSIDEPYMRD